MKNRGQVLVLFVILLPILLLLLVLIIDTGITYSEKKQISDTVKDTITYGFKHLANQDIKDRMEKLLIKNISDMDSYSIILETDTIKILVEKKINGFLKTDYTVKIKYIGQYENNKLVIKKN